MKQKKIKPIDFIKIRSLFRFIYGKEYGNAVKSRLPKMYHPMLKDLENVIEQWMDRWKEFKKQD